jgi:hypothetical protein
MLDTLFLFRGMLYSFFFLWIMVLREFWLTCFFNSAEDMKWFGLA